MILPEREEDGNYKLGLWVRDAVAGIGTITFYEPDSKKCAVLGHGITDIDTKDLINISDGELVKAQIISVEKGKKGEPGEIRGSIDKALNLGNIYKNTKFGIYGNILNINNLKIDKSKEMEVALREEIQLGKAEIWCKLEEEEEIGSYEIEIQKLFINNNENNKSMLIKVTDPKLLEKTGGIIQGMSGSPIIQNGKFIGAITHVLINDPEIGYGVFADIMIKEINE